MFSLLFLAFASFILSLFLTPLVKKLAWWCGLVDHPDEKRKFHATPTPRLGGVAIFASVFCAYGLLLLVRLHSGQIVWADLPFVTRLAPAIVIVFTAGLIDDIVTLRPWIKLIAQLVAAVYAWFCGIHVSVFADYSLFGSASFLVTVLWIVLCTNAINLIDGLDGLAAGVSLFSMLGMLAAALLTHNYPLALAVVPLAGALIGFLRYNFQPASIFLGDSGSMTLGFLLGCFGAVWSGRSTTLLGLTAPLLVLAVPLLDVVIAVARRFLRGRPIFSADRAHIHHKLLALGLGPRNVDLVIYGICAIGAIISLLLTIYHDRYRGFVLIVVCLAAWRGLLFLNYREFSIAGRIIMGGVLHSVLSAQLALEQFEAEICETATHQQCWDSLCRAFPQFGFSGAFFYLDEVVHRSGVDTGYQVRIDFPGHGHINLWRASDVKGRNAAGVLFLDSVARVFREKLAASESANLPSLRSGTHDD